MPSLAIVVPCYNEQEVLPETIKRLSALLVRLAATHKIDGNSRIYLVDDGSRDRTWLLVEDHAAQGWPIVGIKLSRNRGHQNALLAGLFAARGDAIVSIDADLQDDVDAIEAMLDHHVAGCDVVYGVRRARTTDTAFKRLTAVGFYRLMRLLGAKTIDNHADFRLLSRRAVESLKAFGEVNLYLRGIVPMLGYPSAIVEYDRAERFAGETKYPLRRMLSLALNAVTSFSVVPLRLISLLGLLLSLGTMAVSAWVLAVSLHPERVVPGWASTVLPIYFLGGVQLLSLGVIGEYVGKPYLESKARPRYFIERIVGALPADEVTR
ncbi:MAG TPA: glycosyltransferase family 2 protein [Rhodocyclaceae bacterium]|nr:glycosyltransferase family 2 protein [Rhodocyclaceae bacterium]HNH13932.1 glycosyltransferase family 2 protein [Rhodocyclaceae bacterium]